MKARLTIGACAAVSLAILAGCGSSSSSSSSGSSGGVSGTNLTVYSSLPLQGAIAPELAGRRERRQPGAGRGQRQGRQVHDHLQDARRLDCPVRKVGSPARRPVTRTRRSTTRTRSVTSGSSTPGASAISIPLLNQAGIAADQPVQHGRRSDVERPGSTPGEPQKYYPTGKRTYARVVPKDTIQAAAQVTLWKRTGAQASTCFDDQEVYGAGLAKNAVVAAGPAGMKIVANVALRPEGGQLPVRGGQRSPRPAPTACSSSNDRQQQRGAADQGHRGRRCRTRRSSPPTATGLDTFFDPTQGGIPTSIDPRVFMTVATSTPSAYPPSGQAFFKTYQAKYGTPVAYAVYGYESMALMLDAIKRATNNGTAAAIAVQGRRGDLRDEEPSQRARDVQHRRQRRHHADRLRLVEDRQRQVRVLEGHPPGWPEGNRAWRDRSVGASSRSPPTRGRRVGGELRRHPRPAGARRRRCGRPVACRPAIR